ncbi:MAG: hypothetical protein DHS20C11_27760 [Lysobacteraceae bacterium]|nr:MAG: hypothetical protein DHS20C11_27760 [Xanthomonadaceae bacterium]
MQERNGWEFVSRTNPGGAVVILAVTPQQRLLFVEQYRIPVAAPTIEFPAGLIGDKAAGSHDTAISAAHRELVEETGYRAESIEILTAGPSSAGMSSESVIMVRARGLIKVGDGGGVDGEDITVHEVPLPQVDAWIDAKESEGCLIDAKLYGGLYLLR